MTKGRYKKFNEALLKGLIGDMLTIDIRAAAVTAGYTPNLSTHEFLSSITGGDIRATATVPTSGRTATLGAFDIPDPVFSAVAAGTDIKQIVYYVYNASSAAARLIHVDDQATGLPKATNGSDVTHVITDALFEI